MTDLLTACKLAYRKYHLNDNSIGWHELGECLLDALCNEMGDESFQKWLAAYKDTEIVKVNSVNIEGQEDTRWGIPPVCGHCGGRHWTNYSC